MLPGSTLGLMCSSALLLWRRYYPPPQILLPRTFVSFAVSRTSDKMSGKLKAHILEPYYVYYLTHIWPSELFHNSIAKA